MMESLQILNAVRQIVNGQQPDIDISDILYSHDCLFLLSKIKSDSEEISNGRALIAANMITVKERYKACEAVFSALEGIEYAVIKGAALAHTAYGNTAFRRSSDIDLLTSRKNVDEIKKILLQNGFIQGRIVGKELVPFSRQELLYHSALSHQTAPFLKKTGSRFCPIVNIDVNMDIFWGESKKQSDMDCFLKNTEKIELCGITVKKLSAAAEFISLCLHHYKDINSIYLLSQGSLKLSLFCDIYFYLTNNPLDVSELKTLCERFDTAEYVWYCINAANELFCDYKLLSYLEALDSENARALQDCFGLDKNERKKWNSDLCSRLFKSGVKEDFLLLLSEVDLEKIEANKKYMM